MCPASDLTILVLEDYAVVRESLIANIRISEPKSVIHGVRTYDEAVEKLSMIKCDIAFLDIDLRGEKSGIDVLHYIREHELETRAIMLSAETGREIVLRCIDDGASGYIPKDAGGDNLFRRALDTVFQGSVFLPPEALGPGGFTPASLSTKAAISAEQIGVNGRLSETLYYLCQGLPNKSIARKMGISEETVRKDYNTRLFQLFKVARRTELIVEIARRGIIVPKPPAVEKASAS